MCAVYEIIDNESMSEKKKLPPLIQGFSAENVLRLLGTLKETQNGTVIYRHVSHAIHEMERAQNKICFGYATVLYNIIKALRNQLPKESLLNLELKLIQQRLAPPITITELAAIQGYLIKTITIMSKLARPDEREWLEILKPLVETLTPDETINEIKAEINRAITDESESNVAKLDPRDIQLEELDSRADIKLPPVTKGEKAPVTEEFSEQQNNLMASIFDAMQHQARFGLLLEDMLSRLQKAENKQDVDAVRGHAINELQHMLSEQSALDRTLNETQTFANMIKQSSQKLSKELKQVRILSLTDELTELPNRRAFLNRLHEEIQRAKRYGSSFSIAYMDLDEFKKINDTYGHAAGDEMLKRYAAEVLSIFRVSDLVARYGGEEFAVIFPNTSVAEALRALEKAQALAFTVSVPFDGDEIRAPSFSAGLAAYQQNEKAESLINRVDNLLYRAKEGGRRRIEIEDEVDQFGLPVLKGK